MDFFPCYDAQKERRIDVKNFNNSFNMKGFSPYEHHLVVVFLISSLESFISLNAHPSRCRMFFHATRHANQ